MVTDLYLMLEVKKTFIHTVFEGRKNGLFLVNLQTITTNRRT
jgi:hypothetical protein